MKFWKILGAIFSLLIFASLISPFLKPGFFAGHDTIIHFIYISKFTDALSQGQFPVRWIDWNVPGFNHPVFNFYQPGFFYLFSFYKELGFSNQFSIHSLSLIIWLASSGFMYLFLRRHFSLFPALLGSILYTFAPYHILDIFVRSAFPEFSAIAVLPGVFWAIKAAYDSGKGYWYCLLAIFLSLVLIFHPPTLLMFSPIIVLYIIILSLENKDKRFFIQSIIALISGLGLTSFFILPAFVEQKYIQTLYLREGFYDFKNHFVCLSQLIIPFWDYGTTQVDCTDGISFQVGLMNWFMALAVLLFLGVKWFKKFKEDLSSIVDFTTTNIDYYLILLFISFFFISLYMTTAIALPLWENLPYLAYIQYPWRFLIVAVFSSSFLGAFLLSRIKIPPLMLIIYVVSVLLIILAYGSYLKPIKYLDETEVDFKTWEFKPGFWQAENFVPEPGYLPKWTEVLPGPQDRPIKEIGFFIPSEITSSNLNVATDSATLKSSSLKAHEKSYSLEINKPSIVQFYTHFYPGWKLIINRKEVIPSYENMYGFMRVLLEPGKYEASIKFQNTPLRSVANLATISFAFVAISFIFLFNKKENGKAL
ncbi:glycosyltransferase family 39 protein [Candidatus Daviesbacteria bacterium]|nr:glycosyltransferase family 39 protein [Candidatus Daviesbacteria bacterium]